MGEFSGIRWRRYGDHSPGGGSECCYSVQISCNLCVSVRVCVCALDPRHPDYIVSSSSALCLYSFFFFFLLKFYRRHAEYAQSLQHTLPFLRHKDFTFDFDGFSGRQGAFPVQEGVKNTQSERNSEKLLEMLADYGSALMSESWQSQLCARGRMRAREEEAKNHKLLSCSEWNNSFGAVFNC